jgi:hypothetical protein
LFGRSPRLPIAQVDNLDFLDLANPIEGAETIHNRRAGLIHQFRKNWSGQDHIKALAKAHRVAPRKRNESELLNGQTVYFWLQQERKAPHAKQKWKGPGIIIGNWGTELLLGYQNQALQVAGENARATNDIFKLIGSDGQLQLHSMGGKAPLANIADARTLVHLTRCQVGVQHTNANLKAQDVSADSSETLKELGIPENSHFAKFISGGEEDFNMSKKNLSLAESKRVGVEIQKHIDNLQGNLKENILTRKTTKYVRIQIRTSFKTGCRTRKQ